MSEADESAVDSLRQSHENPTEWNLRRQFLLKNYDQVSFERLECLSNCFINVEMYGASYPLPVMKQIKSMGESVREAADAVKAKRASVGKVHFVAAGGSGGGGSGSGGSGSGGSGSSYNHGDRRRAWDHSRESGYGGYHYQEAAKVPKLEFGSSKMDSECPSTSFLNPNSTTSKSCATSAAPCTSSKAETSAMKERCEQLDAKFRQESDRQEMRDMEYRVMQWARDISSVKETRKDESVLQILHSSAGKRHLKLSWVHEVLCKGMGQIKFQNSLFSCKFMLNDKCVLSQGVGRSKKDSKSASVDSFLKIIESGKYEVSKDWETNLLYLKPTFMRRPEPLDLEAAIKASEQILASRAKSLPPPISAPAPAAASGAQNVHLDCPPFDQSVLSGFYLRENSENKKSQSTPGAILKFSSDFCHVSMDYEFEENTCSVRIGGQVLAVARSDSRAFAKTVASEQALLRLRQCCWTMIFASGKEHFQTMADEGFSKAFMSSGSFESSDSLKLTTDNNIGAKMLAKMGWGGGGIGKEEQGRVEPVAADVTQVRRQGLGRGVETDVIEEIKKMLREYAASEQEEDLYFSTEYTPDERKVIHHESRILGLASRSHDAQGGRCMVVGRRRTAEQLFDYVKRMGGRTTRYELIAPGHHPTLKNT